MDSGSKAGKGIGNYLIVADDFTGANDSGVQIRRRGIPVKVVFSAAEISGGSSFVLDTESRFILERDAFRKIISGSGEIPFHSFSRVIKKVDSTLRGNAGGETKVLDSLYKPDMVVFAPAFPDLGRTTSCGIHRINGTPVSKSEFANDPKTPVREDNIQKIMTEAFAEDAVHVDLETLRSKKVNFGKGRIFTFDAVTNSDLVSIVEMVLAEKKRVLWAGCAGLVDILLGIDIPCPPAFAAVASLSSVTRAQVVFAEKQGIEIVKIPLYEIIEKASSPEKFADASISVLKNGKDLILAPSSICSEEEQIKTEECAIRAGMTNESMGSFVRNIIGGIILQVIENAKISGLFLSGGDTAMSFFEKAGAKGSIITSEISLGIPMMRLLGGKHEGMKVITKAGGFGKEDAIFYSMRKLRET